MDGHLDFRRIERRGRYPGQILEEPYELLTEPQQLGSESDFPGGTRLRRAASLMPP
jgi:hypothetical protein